LVFGKRDHKIAEKKNIIVAGWKASQPKYATCPLIENQGGKQKKKKRKTSISTKKDRIPADQRDFCTKRNEPTSISRKGSAHAHVSGGRAKFYPTRN